MTDSLEAHPADSQDEAGLNLPARPVVSADVQVTLTLPAAIVSALQQAAPQPIDQQILALIQQALNCSSANPMSDRAIDSSQAAKQPQESAQPDSPAERSLLQEVEQLNHRLRVLEALLPRIEAIEQNVDRLAKERETSPPQASSIPSPPATRPADSGLHQTERAAVDQAQHQAQHQAQNKAENKGDNPGSSVAAIWMQIQQSDRPPASIPSTLQPSPCPKCQQRLMPFKSTGRAVCIQCGWTNKLDEGTANPLLADTDIHQLLEQAEIASLENMKPRKRST